MLARMVGAAFSRKCSTSINRATLLRKAVQLMMERRLSSCDSGDEQPSEDPSVGVSTVHSISENDSYRFVVDNASVLMMGGSLELQVQYPD